MSRASNAMETGRRATWATGTRSAAIQTKAFWTVAICTGAMCAACGTIDLGDNFVPPDLALDEDFFFCRIQPEVIGPSSCAGGASGEAGSCHSARSALRLDPMAESAPAPGCEDDVLLSDPPPSYRTNLDAVRASVQSDPLSSPLYRRPIGLDSHPRMIFDEASPEADLIFQWILMGGT